MLIKCPECGKEISDKAVYCPRCGCPIDVCGDGVKAIDEDCIVYQGNRINLLNIVYIYGMSKNGAINFLNRQYSLPIETATQIMNRYYDKILEDGDSEIAKKILKQVDQYNKPIKDKTTIENKGYFKEAWHTLVKIGTKDSTVHCPKCGSTSLSYQNKRLSLGRAIAGDAIAGAPGAVMGALSSKKGYAVCLNCGKKWKL